MPCRNEAETVARCVNQAVAYLRRHRVEGEVLVADNGSTDASREEAETAGARVISVPAPGYGNALLAGIRAARGRFVVMGDADESYDFRHLDPFLQRLRQGHELVIGNRFAGGIRPGAMPFLHRYLGNPALSFLGRLFFRCPVRDFHCGLRGFDRQAILGLDLTSGGMEFASEMVVKATLHGLRISEVPTTLSPDGRSGRPHLRRWRDGWRHLRFLLLFSPRWLFLYPGAALLVIGVASMAWLVPGPRQVGPVNLDVNTLLYCGAAIVCGFQAMAFAVFAKLAAIRTLLLPEDPRLRWLGREHVLEGGLAIGLSLFLAGLAGSLYAVGFWGQAAFGPLDPQVSLRIVAPAVTALILGMQIIFSSFFLGVLHLPRA
ncbi:MAG: glycosyltransferase family 2 protein [Gemmatimonadota bacterium]